MRTKPKYKPRDRQRQTTIFDELVIDNFAGGGGASTGIEAAIGRPIDIAINHDPEAIAMHEANHPLTKHYCESVWDVDPVAVADGRPVGLVWLSPDCTHFSKAKGGKPREKKIRGLAWIGYKWAAAVSPRILILENVEEFKTWGPLLKDGQPCPLRKGETFRRFVRKFQRLGYAVEWRELIAADYGAPTTRKRLFMIMRRDGEPITWPKPSHGKPGSKEVAQDLRLPWRTAAEIIDWSLPIGSIFERKKPLADNTLRRIAFGIQKYVLNAAQPFIVTSNHSGEGFRGQGLGVPFKTVTASRDDHQVIVPTLVQTGYGERKGQAPRVPGLEKPIGALMGQGQKHALAVAALIKHYGGNCKFSGVELSEPVHTITSQDHHHLMAVHLNRQFGESIGQECDAPAPTITAGGQGKTALIASNLVKLRGTSNACSMDAPVPTITGGGTHIAEVRAFLDIYNGENKFGQSLNEPAKTVTANDRMSLVTIDSIDYVIVDIGMRMLEPHELFAAQGFPNDYIIEPIFNKKPLTKTAKVRMVGNSVCPPVSEALVRANFRTASRQAA